MYEYNRISALINLLVNNLNQLLENQLGNKFYYVWYSSVCDFSVGLPLA